MNIFSAEKAKAQSNRNLIENYGNIISNGINKAILDGKCMVILPHKIEDIPLELKDVLREKGYKFSSLGSKSYITWYH
jgi:hypothetical protein